MLGESIGVVDKLDVKLIRDGRIVEHRVTASKHPLMQWLVKVLRFFGYKKFADDLVTDTGKAMIANYLSTTFGYVAIGTDDGTTLALDSTNTTLGAESHRVASTNSVITKNVTDDTAKFEATFNFTGSYTIQESGIFDADTNGNMLARQTFPAINVQDGDSLIVTWEVTVQ